MSNRRQPNLTTSEHHEKPPHRRVDDCAVVEEIYLFGEKLGEGSFGTVIAATHKSTGKKWAVKRINKEKTGKTTILLLEREVGILRRVFHPNIIQLNEVIETPKNMYLVMDLCQIGELKSLLENRGPFTETTTHHITKCLINAIVYLHRNGIVHRDLKLDNILVAEESGDAENPLFDIKLTDFGLSVVKGLGRDAMLQTTCGTPVYMAPEVIQNHDYTQQCDIWSAGVIVFALLTKNFPFVADKEEKLFEIIKKGTVDFSSVKWTNISSAAKDFISNLLVVDPAYRLTAPEASNHPWILGHNDIKATPNVLTLMKDFNTRRPSLGSQISSDEEENSNKEDESKKEANETRTMKDEASSSKPQARHKRVTRSLLSFQIQQIPFFSRFW